MKNNKGFTLVEVLAVITILGVIIIFALPTALDTIGKSRKKMNEYTKKNIEDSARMYFTDIVNKTNPDVYNYKLAPGEKFKSVVTNRRYCGNKEENGCDSDRIFGYDFILYSLLKTPLKGDDVLTPEITAINVENEEDIFYAASPNSDLFNYGGTKYFVELGDDDNPTPIKDDAIVRNNIIVTLYDLVDKKYYNPECIYKGMTIKDNAGEDIRATESDERGCSVESTCRVQLELTAKLNKNSNLLEVANYNMSIPDYYYVTDEQYKEITGNEPDDKVIREASNDNKIRMENDCNMKNKK